MAPFRPETRPDFQIVNSAQLLFARGIWHGDKLPAIPGIITEPTILDFSFMQMGEGPRGESRQVSPSWLARMVALRDRLGPFRIAFLEAVLRAADARALMGQPAAQNASSNLPAGIAIHEPARPYGDSPPLSPEEQSLVDDLVADGLSIQDKFRPEPLYKQTGKGHYEGGTVEEIRRAREQGTQGDKS